MTPGEAPTVGNSSFSTQAPGLQLAVDSTSLGEFKKCPRAYQLGIIEGWQTSRISVHLEFGIWFHGACERYDHQRADGAPHQDALRVALHWVMQQTWNKKLNRGWVSDHSTKNRLTLVQTLVWYLDHYSLDEQVITHRLANGKPAVELSFSFDSGTTSQLTGEPKMLCGHLDRVVVMADHFYISDRKTTGGSLGPGFFRQFSPDNQMSLYTAAGFIALDIPVRGVLVDGIQVLVGSSRFERGLAHRTQGQIEEWLAATHQWLGQMDQCAESGDWPMNDKSCGLYGGCQFREVCSRPPGARDQWLRLNFTRRVWDPLQRRGDV